MSLLLSFLAVSAFEMSRQPDFHRAWQTDEVVTLQNYTWAGLNDDGTRRNLDRLSAIQNLGTPTPKRFLMGVYCSLGRWSEPNNHTIFSLLTSVPLAFLDDKLVAFRLPALVIAVAFALAIAGVCWRCGWRTMAFATGAVAFWNPYVIHYAQEGRGYTLMLLLVVLFLFASERTLRKPSATAPASILVLLSVLLFQNTVNMAVDWVGPCFLLMMAFPGLFDDQPTTDQSSARRKSLLIQMLCIGLVGFVFLMDRLPYVYSSALQYGMTMKSQGELLGLLANHLHFLFPSPLWMGFLVLGVLGVGMALRERPGRGYLALSAMAVVAALVHYAATKRFAYERNVGYWIVPLLLGYGCLGQRLYDALQRKWGAAAGVVVVYGMSLALAASGLQISLRDHAYHTFNAFQTQLHELRSDSAGGPALVLQGPDLADEIRLHFPENWSESKITNEAGTALDLILVEKRYSILQLSRAGDFTTSRSLPDWPGAEVIVQAGGFSATRLPCSVATNWPDRPPPRAVVLWYPSIESVSMTSDKVHEFLDQSGVRFFPVNIRYQMKMDVFSRLAYVVTAAWTPEESKHLQEVFEEARKRLGGNVVVLLPRE